MNTLHETAPMLAALNATDYGLIAAAAIVLLGLFVYGLGDLLRFSPGRVWAIGGVVFRESIRRRVLWLAPLAMLGVLLVSQFFQPADEVDAIRQTVQFCVFTAAMLVVLASVVLSCTSLPRDIESKVIFTIVTKPTTRFELVVGKILGFARVTGTLLIAMGLFTYGYVAYQSWSLGNQIETRLADPNLSQFTRQWLEHHKAVGLLETRRIAVPASVDVVAHIDEADPALRFFGESQDLWVPFEVTPEQLIPAGAGDVPPGAGGVRVDLNLIARQVGEADLSAAELENPFDRPTIDPMRPAGVPEVTVVFHNEFGEPIVPSSQIDNGKPIEIVPGQWLRVPAAVSPQGAQVLATARRFVMRVSVANPNFQLGIGRGEVARLIVPAVPPAEPLVIPQAQSERGFAKVQVRGRNSRGGMQVDGPGAGAQAFARYQFINARPAVVNDMAAIEVRVGIERSGEDADTEDAEADISILPRDSSTDGFTKRVVLESNRPAFVEVPAAAFGDGNVEIRISPVTAARSISVNDDSIGVVTARHSFFLNLGKSFICWWMLSILVVTVGLFCSTFVSWPIAIVLSIVMLMGHWAVNQVRDSLQPGIGAQIAETYAPGSFEQSRVIASTFEGMADILKGVSQFLPDISRFSTTRSLERMTIIEPSQIMAALIMLTVFGLPLLVLGYVFLRNKEVAP